MNAHLTMGLDAALKPRHGLISQTELRESFIHMVLLLLLCILLRLLFYYETVMVMAGGDKH